MPNVLIDIILVIVFVVLGAFLLTRASIANAVGIFFLVFGLILLIVGVYIGLVLAGLG